VLGFSDSFVIYLIV